MWPAYNPGRYGQDVLAAQMPGLLHQHIGELVRKDEDVTWVQTLQGARRHDWDVRSGVVKPLLQGIVINDRENAFPADPTVIKQSCTS